MIPPFSFPKEIVFVPTERGSSVHVAFEREQIAHPFSRRSQLKYFLSMDWGDERCHSIVEDHVHLATMHLRDHCPPFLDVPVMSIKECKVQWPESIPRPWHINEWAPGQIDALIWVSEYTKKKRTQKRCLTLIPIPWI